MDETAKRTLTEANAVLVTCEAQGFSGVVQARRKWENIPKENADEFIGYLNSLTQTVDDPTDCPDGTYRVLRNVYVNDDGEREIHQFLALGLRQDGSFDAGTPELDPDDPGYVEPSGWRRKSGRNYRGSNNSEILELRYCDPAYIDAIMNENTDETYTNSIYTENEGLLEGTWHNLHTDYIVDEEGGWATVFWYLSKQANDDLHFAYQRDDNAFVVDLFKFDAADTGLASFESDYYFDALGDWYISTDGLLYTSKNGVAASGILPTGNGIGNARSHLPGRICKTDINRSETTRFYTMHTQVIFFEQQPVCTTYMKTPNTRSVEFFLIGASRLDLNDSLSKYYFSDSGDWFYSEDGTLYSYKNGVAEAGAIVAGSAWSLAQIVATRTATVEIAPHPIESIYTLNAKIDHFTARNSEIVTHPNGDLTYLGFKTAALPDFSFLASTYLVQPLFTQQHDDDTYSYVFNVKAQRVPASGNNTATYGTPDVTVTDKLVSGATDITEVASASYNAAGTQKVETQVMSPSFDDETGTYSYLLRTITTYAPHSNHTTGEVGYVEGPSEVKLEVQSATLARGVGSGFASLGSWGGGGQARVRKIATADGGFDYQTPGTVQASKNFQPYNIGISRSSKVQTATRLYYYVKEPTTAQYPTDHGAPVEDLGVGVLSNYAFPTVTSVVESSDTTSTYGPAFERAAVVSPLEYSNQWWVDGTNYYGKLTRYNYSDGAFTLVYYRAYYKNGESPGHEGWADNTHWREPFFIRTYQSGDTPNYTYTLDTPAPTNPPYDVAGYPVVITDEWHANDPGVDGHYQFSDDSFYTESIRHKILKVSESIYALAIETQGRTIWAADDVHKWILNAEGEDWSYKAPISVPPSSFI